MHLAQGEPGYLPDGLFGYVQDEAHLDLAMYLRCAVDQPMTWAVAAVLADRGGWCWVEEFVASLGMSTQEVVACLGILEEIGLVQMQVLVVGPRVRIHACRRVRSFVSLLASLSKAD